MTIKAPTDILLKVVKSLTENGVQFSEHPLVKRNVRLTNYLCLIILSANLIVLFHRVILGVATGELAVLLLTESAFCAMPIMLNRYGYLNLSRVSLSWFPPIFTTFNALYVLSQSAQIETSVYLGFRFFLISTGWAPFLIFSLSERRLLLLSLCVPLACLVFFDPILDFMGYGYFQKGLKELTYSYNNFRTILSYFILGASFFLLKRMVEASENANAKLLEELSEKNKLILERAAEEVSLLDNQLYQKIEELKERELILNQSQKIAKIGSWQYTVGDDSIVFSDEMYNILELEKGSTPKVEAMVERFKGDINEECITAYDKLLKRGEPLAITLSIYMSNGSKKWLHVDGFALRNHRGISGAMGVCHDITGFKEAEEKLSVSEKKYRSLFEQASDPIMVTDFNGKFLDVNSSMEGSLGYKKDELLRMNITDVIEAEDLRTNPIQFKELSEGKHIVNERVIIKKDGAKFPIEGNVKRIGENALLSIWRDLSERRDTARKLKKSIRELGLLNTINTLSAKAIDSTQLLKSLCEVLLSDGSYKLAWIGKEFLASNEHVIRPIISVGDSTGYLRDFVIDVRDERHRKGPAVSALLTGHSKVINEILHDQDYKVWRSKATGHGFKSSVAICINIAPIERYILSIYSSRSDAFDDNEVSVLERIAENVTTAIKSIHASIERDSAKKDLQLAYERLSYHVNNTPLAVIERDKNLKITSWNQRAEELFGWRQDEVIGLMTQDVIIPNEDRQEGIKNLHEMLHADQSAYVKEIRNVTRSGKILYCHWYYSVLRNADGSTQRLLSFVSDITEQRNANYQLNERVKELTTVKQVSQLLTREDEILDDLLFKIVQILPPGWQYPNVTAARIVVGGIEFKTPNFSKPFHKQRAAFVLPQGMKGIIEVAYTEARPDEAEGPFLAEERNLIDMLAEMLHIFFAKRHESMALKRSEANLSATINNTDTLIWSLDRNLNLTTFNTAFYQYVKKYYNTEIKVGEKILTARTQNEASRVNKWDRFYQRALSGEKIAHEESNYGIDFQYSICPIVEDGQRITGVNIFAMNVTLQKQGANALMEANKQIGELKLTALRSVMNPHFIFNALNSIQFFIAANDRLNAINYLSKFSKLVRNILTNSVNDKIRLADEIDILKNYVQLEMVRFDNKFDFNLDLDPDLEIDSIEVPSLLVQPYVENAILHGLYNKQGRGHLSIRIKDDDDAVVFEIEDDGVGREAAKAIRERNFAAHKSMGIKLTEERLKLINESRNVSFEITDLKNDDFPCGTRVTIWVKV